MYGLWFYILLRDNAHTLTIRLSAREFYEVIVDEAEGRINYRLLERSSE